jgi:hypothetical protein
LLKSQAFFLFFFCLHDAVELARLENIQEAENVEQNDDAGETVLNTTSLIKEQPRRGRPAGKSSNRSSRRIRHDDGNDMTGVFNRHRQIFVRANYALTSQMEAAILRYDPNFPKREVERFVQTAWHLFEEFIAMPQLVENLVGVVNFSSEAGFIFALY